MRAICLGSALALGSTAVAWAGEPEAYQHLAERMDRYFSDDRPRLIESFAPPYPLGPDGTLEGHAFVYDNALAVLVFLSRGTPDDLRRAKLICDALRWYQDHDVFADGRLRQAYRADQDLTRAARPEIPTQFNHSLTGDQAWAGLALLAHYQQARVSAYLRAATRIAQYLAWNVRDPRSVGWFLGFEEQPREITVGVPSQLYGRITISATTLRIPLSAFASRGLNLDRLRAVSLLFNDPINKRGSLTFDRIAFVNEATGASMTIDDFADLRPATNALGFQIGGIVDLGSDPAGRTIRWNSDDGTVDWWYSLLFDADRRPLARLNASRYTHLVLTVTGGSGGERITVELQGYPLKQQLVTSKSAEHNLDAYVLFSRLFDVTRNPQWNTYAQEAKRFVTERAWDPVEGKFWAGTEPGGAADTRHLVEDAQAFALLALGNVESYGGALAWASRMLENSSDGFTGFDFGLNVDPSDPWYSPSPDGVWFEGTAHMACANQVSGAAGASDNSAFYLRELDRAQQSALHANGKGLVAASHDGITTGLPFFSLSSSGHIGATAWYLAARRHLNLFWGTGTAEPVPHDNLPPALTVPATLQTIGEGAAGGFAVSAEDPEGKPVSLSATLADGRSVGAIGATFTDAGDGTGTFAWTPNDLQGAGVYSLAIVTSDGRHQVTRLVSVRVLEAVLAFDGTVRNQAGIGVAGVRVEVSGLGRYPGGTAIASVTDAQGRFHLTNLQSADEVAARVSSCRERGACQALAAKVAPVGLAPLRITPAYRVVLVSPALLHDATAVNFAVSPSK